MRKLEEVTVEVIQRCNSRCIFCSSMSTNTSNHEIPLIKLLEISSFAKEKGATTINISGGEPFLKTDILEYIKFNSDHDLASTLYTSGNVDSDIVRSFLKKFIISGINKEKLQIIFNYQSSDEKVFKELTDTAFFGLDAIDENLGMFVSNGFNVEAHIVPNAVNINSLFLTVKHLKDIGVKKASLLRMVFQGRAAINKNKLKLENQDELEAVVRKIKIYVCDETFLLRTGIPFSNFSDHLLTCNAGYKKLIFKYDGTVFPCEAFKEAPNNEEYIMGNIFNDDIDQIWEKYHSMEILKNLKLSAHNKCELCPAQLLY